MAYQICSDCGCKMYNGFCTNCNEEVFIAEQYRDLGDPIPEMIQQKEKEHLANPSIAYEPRNI
jgi:hypothetical protein